MALKTLYPINGGLNQDLSELFIKSRNGEVVERRNGRINSSEKNKIGVNTPMKGMLKISNAYLPTSGTNKVVHYVEDIERDAGIFFLYNSEGNHCIFSFNSIQETISIIIKNEPLLNFNLDYPISSNIVGDLIYWTDGLNEPRKINIATIGNLFGDISSFIEPQGNITQFINNGSTVKIISANHLVRQGDTILISGNVNYNGTYTVAYVGVNDFDIVMPFAGDGTGVWTSQSRIKVNVTNGGAITDRDQIRISSLNYNGIFDISEIINGSVIIKTLFDGGTGGQPAEWSIISEETITAAKIPPYKPPDVYNDSKGGLFTQGYWDDANYKNNNLRGKQFQFCYRWIYDDKEKSLFSPFSVVPIPHQEEAIGGFFVDDITTNNTLSIKIKTGSRHVKKIELAVKVGEGVWQSYDVLDKAELSISDNITKTYIFRNDKVPFPLDQKEVFQSNNFIPQLSFAQEFLPTKELAYGRIQEGYPNITDMDMDISINPTDVPDWYQTVRSIDRLGSDITVYDKTDDYGDGHYLYSFFRLPATPQTDKIHTIRILYPDKKIISVDTSEFDWGSGTYPLNLKQYLISELEKKGANKTPTVKAAWKIENGDVIDDGLSTGSKPDNELWFFLSSINGLYNDRKGAGISNLIKVEAYYYDPIELEDSIIKKRTLKHGEYKVGLVYKDKYGRIGSVQSNENSEIFIDSRNFSGNDANEIVNLDWNIKHVPPIWAYSYQIVMSKNLSEKNVFQWVVSRVINFYENGVQYVALDINTSIIDNKKINNNLSYEPYLFKKGDFVRRIGSLTSNYQWFNSYIEYNFEVVKVDFIKTKKIKNYHLESGEWEYIDVDVIDDSGDAIDDEFFQRVVIRNDVNIVWSPGFSYLAEIVTPQKELPETIYHEIGEAYEIGNPTLSNRYHKGQSQNQDPDNPSSTPASGTIKNGDYVYRVRYDLSKGVDFPCVDKNVSDYYISREDGFGRIFVEDKDSEQKFYNRLRHSGKYFEDTNINYLSSFNGDNYVNISDRHGNITDIKQAGDVLKVIQKNKLTSIYIGKSILTSAGSEQANQLSTVDRTFGTVLPSIDNFGSNRKLSISSHNRHLYFFDEYRGEMVRSAPNGEFPISSYGFRSYFSKKKDELIEAKKNGKQNEVLSWFDIEHNELIVTFIIDGVTETVAFLEGDNSWINFYDWELPDLYGNVGDILFSFKDGELYLHEKTQNYNTFYGEVKPFSLSFIVNEIPDNDKSFLSISLDSTTAFRVDIDTPITATRPVGQHTFIKEAAFVEKQGNIEAAFPKNIRRVDNGEDLESLLFTGSKMTGKFATIKLTKDVPVDFNLYRAEIEYLQML